MRWALCCPQNKNKRNPFIEKTHELNKVVCFLFCTLGPPYPGPNLPQQFLLALIYTFSWNMHFTITDVGEIPLFMSHVLLTQRMWHERWKCHMSERTISYSFMHILWNPPQRGSFVLGTTLWITYPWLHNIRQTGLSFSPSLTNCRKWESMFMLYFF